jgi:hypothetical protein
MLPTDDATFSILRNKYRTLLIHSIYCTTFQYDPQTVNIIVQYFILHNNIDRLGAALGTQHVMRMRHIVICDLHHYTIFFNIFPQTARFIKSYRI